MFLRNEGVSGARRAGSLESRPMQFPRLSRRPSRAPRALLATLAVLAPGGAVYFCTSHPRFAPQLDGLAARELTAEVIPEDYRDRAPHRLWRVTA